MADLSPADIASLTRNNNGYGTMFGGLDGLVWLVAIAAMFGGGGFFGNRNGAGDAVTSAELQASQNAQTNAIMQQNLSDSIGQTKYDIAQAINQQTNALEQQNNANLINAIQGFNNLGSQITNQTNQISTQLMNQTNTLTTQLQQVLSQLSSCCCEIKTQMLQNRYEDERAKNVTLQNSIDNANQSQYLLNQLGRFVAWAGTGSQAAIATG